MREPLTSVTDDAVVHVLRDEWGLDPASVSHLPWGFGAWHWAASDLSGRRRWFVTADEIDHSGRAHELETTYAAALALHDAGLGSVVPCRAPTEWRDLLDELVATFELTVDQTGSTFGFDYWVEQVARGSAPPSLVGRGMQLPASQPITNVPIISPTPVFWWWAMWRRRLPTNLTSQFLATLAGIEPDQSTDLWMPQRDNQFRLRTGPRTNPTPQVPVEDGGLRWSSQHPY